MPANTKPMPLFDHAADLAFWKTHNKAANAALAAGACRRCAAEAGFRATDAPDAAPREYRMHSLCAIRIAEATGKDA
jgi:hypothetical protein